MPREVEIRARMPETAAVDVESARFGDDASNDKQSHQARYEEYAAAIKKVLLAED